MGLRRRRPGRPPRYGLHRTGHPGQIRSTQLGESREPRAESREPRAESREPRAESREPRAESREPRAESREPRAESREPRAESREPRAESREPRAESREPRAESREPRAESREPRLYQPPGRTMPRLSRCRSPRPAEISPPLAGEAPGANHPRAACLPAASGEHAAGSAPGASVACAPARGINPSSATQPTGLGCERAGSGAEAGVSDPCSAASGSIDRRPGLPDTPRRRARDFRTHRE